MSDAKDDIKSTLEVEQIYEEKLSAELSAQFPEIDAEVVSRVAKNAPQLGHDDWFKSSKGLYLPYPIKNQPLTIVVNGEEKLYKGRAACIKFENVLQIRKRLEAKQEFSKEEFKSMAAKDLDMDITNLSYIDAISPEDFSKWMHNIAYVNIDDNKSWAISTLRLIKAENIQVTSPEYKEILKGKVMDLFTATAAVTSSSTKSSADYHRIFSDSTLLKMVMITTHGEWKRNEIKRRPETLAAYKGTELQEYEFWQTLGSTSAEESVVMRRAIDSKKATFLLSNLLGSEDNQYDINKVKTYIDTLRERVHFSYYEETDKQTFELMLNLAIIVENEIREEGLREAFRLASIDEGRMNSSQLNIENVRKQNYESLIKELTNARDALLGTLSWDANVAIPMALNIAFDLGIDFQNIDEQDI